LPTCSDFFSQGISFSLLFSDGEILRVLVNSSAQIKCDVGSSQADDKVLLVVWYKNNLPIYR